MLDPDEHPPLGSWSRLYALAIALAVAVMVVLYLLTEAYDMPLGER